MTRRGATRVARAVTANAQVRLKRVERLLDQLAEPRLGLLLLTLGVLAILYELSTPRVGVGGMLGSMLLVLRLPVGAVLVARGHGAAPCS